MIALLDGFDIQTRPVVAIFGAVVSVVGLLGSAAPLVPSSIFVGWCAFFCVHLIAIWTIFLGVILYRYGRCIPATIANTAVMS